MWLTRYGLRYDDCIQCMKCYVYIIQDVQATHYYKKNDENIKGSQQIAS